MSAGGDYSFPMYWESKETRASSWAAFGITQQPAAVLVTADGTKVLGQWNALAESSILQALNEATSS